MAAILPFISHLLHALGVLIRREFGYFFTIALATIAAIVNYGRRWGAKIKRTSARDWPSMSATIDIVSVAPVLKTQKFVDDETTGYKASLTYFYRNPDLQMGDYERHFALHEEARLWSSQFKGRQVNIHINPADPADSVLLPQDIESHGHDSDSHIADAALRHAITALPSLPAVYRLIAVLGELVAMAGMATTVVLLVRNLLGGTALPHWVLWTWAGASLVACGSWLLIWLRLQGAEASDAFLKAYLKWCPAWMRWTSGVCGIAFGITWVLLDIGSQLPEVPRDWLLRVSAKMPYLWSCLIFFSAAAFLKAVVEALVNSPVQHHEQSRPSQSAELL